MYCNLRFIRHRKSSLEFITSIRRKIYATMLKLFMSPLLHLFVVLSLSMLIHIFFIADPVYCAEETITNYANTSTAAATISTDTPNTVLFIYNIMTMVWLSILSKQYPLLRIQLFEPLWKHHQQLKQLLRFTKLHQDPLEHCRTQQEFLFIL